MIFKHFINLLQLNASEYYTCIKQILKNQVTSQHKMRTHNSNSMLFQPEQNPLVLYKYKLKTGQSMHKTQSQTAITQISILSTDTKITISQIACGLNFTILLASNGILYSFGDNFYGQLGYPTDGCANFQKPLPVKITKNQGYRNGYTSGDFRVQVRKISCGDNHAVVYNQREVYGWGCHQFGALGFQHQQIVNTQMPRKLPILISKHQTLKQVICGNNTTILSISSDYYCLGDNRFSQLFYPPSPSPIIHPKPLFFPFNPKQILCMSYSTFALDNNNNLYGMGQLQQFGLRAKNQAGMAAVEQIGKWGHSIKAGRIWGRGGLLGVEDGEQIRIFGKGGKKLQGVKEIKVKGVMGNGKGFVGGKQERYYYYPVNYDSKPIKICQFQQSKGIQDKQKVADIIGCMNNQIVYIHNNYSKQLPQKLQQMRQQQIQQQQNKQGSNNKQYSTMGQQNSQLQQQQHIIQLYQQYVQKLQNQNKQLREKLSSHINKNLNNNSLRFNKNTNINTKTNQIGQHQNINQYQYQQQYQYQYQKQQQQQQQQDKVSKSISILKDVIAECLLLQKNRIGGKEK